MVRLKGYAKLPSARLFYHFNSTMVRLKEINPNGTGILDIEFQFHYGTIKSDYRQGCNCGSTSFQFHYGTIKRKQYNNFCRRG